MKTAQRATQADYYMYNPDFQAISHVYGKWPEPHEEAVRNEAYRRNAEGIVREWVMLEIPMAFYIREDGSFESVSRTGSGYTEAQKAYREARERAARTHESMCGGDGRVCDKVFGQDPHQ